MNILVSLFFFILSLTTGQVALSATTKVCGLFYSGSNPYTALKEPFKFFSMSESPATASDAQFVDRFIQFTESQLTKTKRGGGSLNHTIPWTLEKLLKHPTNHSRIEVFYSNLVQKYLKGDWHLTRDYESAGILIALSKVKEFSQLTDRLVEEALKAGAENKVTVSDFFTRVYKNVTRADLKEQIVDFFIETLFTDDRRILHFGAVNKVPRFRKIPIALGTKKTLERVSKRHGAINYKEWERFGWMMDSKSIPGFAKAFKIVADQTSAIHFEIGDLIKDREGFKKAMTEVAHLVQTHGEQHVLNELADMYEAAGSKGIQHLRLTNGKISITNLEFYWIVTNPKYLAKTIFYDNNKPITVPANALETLIL